MALMSIFLFMFLSTSVSTGFFIEHNAGYRTERGEFYGSRATISAWGVPDMNPNSLYEVSISLLNDDGTGSFIKAGLHVFPALYNNSDLHFFTKWTDDYDKQTGCYNMDCFGFIVADISVLYPGQVVAPLSQYEGDDCFIIISIRKDSVTNLWSLYREYQGKSYKLGWWESRLFTSLAEKATDVQWVGYVAYLDNEAGPAMGSGHYAGEGKNKAAYMADLELFDEDGINYSPPKMIDLVHEVDRPDCYTAVAAMNWDSEVHDRHKFYYGGPAGCRN